MKSMRLSLVGLAALALGSACAAPLPDDGAPAASWAEGRYGGNGRVTDNGSSNSSTGRSASDAWGKVGYVALDVQNGHLRGDVGPVLGVDREGKVAGFSDYGWTSVSTTVTEPSRIAMTIFEVMGDLDHPLFQPGSVHSFRLATVGLSDDPYVAVVGCSNQDSASDGFTYDQTADEVTVAVSQPDDGIVHYRYEASFSAYDEAGQVSGHQIVKGSFDRIVARD